MRGIDIYNVDLHDFDYPDDESALTVSMVLQMMIIPVWLGMRR